MQLALSRPELVAKLVVVDIAPRSYPAHHDEILTGLSAIEAQPFSSRKAVDEALAHWVPEVAVRSFLLKNLILDNGIAHWRIHLDALHKEYAHIAQWPDIEARYGGPVLFLKGANSDYLLAQDKAQVQRHFPKAQLKTIASTGHWPHAEKPAVFNKLLMDFLQLED